MVLHIDLVLPLGHPVEKENHLERFFKNPHTLSCKREGTLGRYIDEFAQQLSEQGYSRQYGRRQLQLAAKLSRWLGKKNLAVADLKVADLENYLKYRSRLVRIRRGDAANLKAFYELLCQKGLVVGRVDPVPKTPIEELQSEFSLYLGEERALAPTMVIGYLPFSRELLTHRFGTGRVDLSKLRAADVVDFVQHRAPSLIRKQAKKMTMVLRSFLQFARYHNYIRTDLAACVPCVADLSATSIPKGLPFKDVKSVLASCNRQRAVGRRDHAILLLLARLGLRAGEVVSLTLEDIDWEHGYLTVRGKGNRSEQLPLPVDVGKALAAYLRAGRPKSTRRHVFLRGYAPAVGFKGPAAVSTVVHHALARAGINCPRKGAHQFRHALATEMLRKGASLPEIGELLRHRHMQTTTIYAKVDLTSLRKLALPWSGGAR